MGTKKGGQRRCRKCFVKWLSGALVLLTALGIFLLCSWGSLEPEKATEGLSKAAFVVAGFIVSAFNLRFRIIDTVQKDFVNHAQARRLREIYSGCRARLDLWIIFFVATAALCAIAPIIPHVKSSIWTAILLWSSFAASSVGFLWILDSFRDLEDGILDRIEKVKADEAYAEMMKQSAEATKLAES